MPLFLGMTSPLRGFEFTIPCFKTADALRDRGGTPAYGPFSSSRTGHARIPLNVRDSNAFFDRPAVFSRGNESAHAPPRRRADRRVRGWRKAAPRPWSAPEPCASTAV